MSVSHLRGVCTYAATTRAEHPPRATVGVRGKGRANVFKVPTLRKVYGEQRSHRRWHMSSSKRWITSALSSASLHTDDDFSTIPPPVEGPASWYGSQVMAQPESWTHNLTDEQIDELDTAVKALAGQEIIGYDML
eukprot:4418932-Pyramimonas_sp.AAC.1